MNRLRGAICRAGFLFLIVSAAACGPDPSTTIVCEGCAEDEVCTYTTTDSGAVSVYGCVAVPGACAADATCDCVDAADDDPVCPDVYQNSCQTIDGAMQVECVTTLG